MTNVYPKRGRLSVWGRTPPCWALSIRANRTPLSANFCSTWQARHQIDFYGLFRKQFWLVNWSWNLAVPLQNWFKSSKLHLEHLNRSCPFLSLLQHVIICVLSVRHTETAKDHSGVYVIYFVCEFEFLIFAGRIPAPQIWSWARYRRCSYLVELRRPAKSKHSALCFSHTGSALLDAKAISAVRKETDRPTENDPIVLKEVSLAVATKPAPSSAKKVTPKKMDGPVKPFIQPFGTSMLTN